MGQAAERSGQESGVVQMATDIVPATGGLNFGSELEETEKALREVTLMIEQSQDKNSYENAFAILFICFLCCFQALLMIYRDCAR